MSRRQARDPKDHHRIAIAGGPRTGKTTLAGITADREVIHTDDIAESLPWAEIPEAVIARCAEHSASVVDGVRVARALRKGLAIDAVIYLDAPHVPLTKQQVAMAKGSLTVFREWLSSGGRAAETAVQ